VRPVSPGPTGSCWSAPRARGPACRRGPRKCA
jgi:hypothetical protein